MSFNSEYEQIKKEIISARREIHQNPELGFEEFKTSDTICRILDAHGINYERNICKTGIVANIGTKKDKVLLIRADMDALPIEEKTELPFSSLKKGVMHACGHDVHIAAALASAIILKNHERELNGSVKILFQPAEETTGGALPMIKQGVLENPDVTCAISGHITPELPVGSIFSKSGPLMASPDDFEIQIIGKSTHGAQPQNGISPIIPAADIVKELDKLSKEVYEKDKSVLSVCSVISDGGINVIPDRALILGTYRSFDEGARKNVDTSIHEFSKRITKLNLCELSYKYNYLYPPLVNDEDTFSFFIECASDVLGRDNVHIISKPLMTGEDFSYFCQSVPSVFFWYGGNNGSDNPLHSSKLVLNEDAIAVAASLFTDFAFKYLR